MCEKCCCPYLVPPWWVTMGVAPPQHGATTPTASPLAYADADGYASAPTSTTTSTPTPARSAIEQWQQLR